MRDALARHLTLDRHARTGAGRKITRTRPRAQRLATDLYKAFLHFSLRTRALPTHPTLNPTSNILLLPLRMGHRFSRLEATLRP